MRQYVENHHSGISLTEVDGIVEAGEECDPGSNATSACCDATSMFCSPPASFADIRSVQVCQWSGVRPLKLGMLLIDLSLRFSRNSLSAISQRHLRLRRGVYRQQRDLSTRSHCQRREILRIEWPSVCERDLHELEPAVSDGWGE